MAALPPDLEQIVIDLERNEAAARHTIAGLTPHLLNWQPKEGRSWSILQCIEHLTITNLGYTQAMEGVLSGSSLPPRRGPIETGLLMGLFVKLLEPPARLKLPAPSPLLPPSALDPDTTLTRWVETHDRLRALLPLGATADFNSVGMANPFQKGMSIKVGAAILIILSHERRHLWQADNVRKSFPRA